MRYITKGTILDYDTNREYPLSGVEVRGVGNQQVVSGGSGYCLEIREEKDMPTLYVLTLVTEISKAGSVAIRTTLQVEAWLKNFEYIGDEEL